MREAGRAPIDGLGRETNLTGDMELLGTGLGAAEGKPQNRLFREWKKGGNLDYSEKLKMCLGSENVSCIVRRHSELGRAEKGPTYPSGANEECENNCCCLEKR